MAFRILEVLALIISNLKKHDKKISYSVRFNFILPSVDCGPSEIYPFQT